MLLILSFFQSNLTSTLFNHISTFIKTSAMAASGSGTPPPQQSSENQQEVLPFIPHDPIRFSWLAWGLDWAGWTSSWIYNPFVFPKEQIMRQVRELAQIKSPVLPDLSPCLDAYSLFLDTIDYSHIPSISQWLMGKTYNSFVSSGVKLANYMKNNPEFVHTPLKDVIFISGLPRTGTTMLQQMMASDSRSRSAYLFEMSYLVNPFPPAPSREALKHDPRLEQMRNKWGMMTTILPEFWKRIGESHFSAPDTQDEELPIGFMLGIFFAHIPVGGEPYYNFFFDPHKDFFYQFLHSFFAMLNHGFAPESHWILKSPVHCLWLDSLSSAFPGSRIIFTHRDPAETIASYCCLQESYVGHLWYPGKLNRAVIGQFIMRMWKLAAERTLEWQKHTDPKMFYNAHYLDITRDPIGTVKKIYNHFGMALPDKETEAFRGWLKENPQGKHGRRAYTPEMYGLSAEGIRKEFRGYIEAFCGHP